jgi:hypothetical protein
MTGALRIHALVRGARVLVRIGAAAEGVRRNHCALLCAAL